MTLLYRKEIYEKEEEEKTAHESTKISTRRRRIISIKSISAGKDKFPPP